MKKPIIVAVSGGFDPIHIGHIQLFKKAKALGDKLYVILNSDDFLMKKKGFVFISFLERAVILQSIKYIDKVITCLDKDQTVNKTLYRLRPDIFANGGDRTTGNVPEEEICRQLGIKLVYKVGGAKIQSSSNLIRKALKKILAI